MLRSRKKVIELENIVGERIFILPRNMANQIDIVDGRPCLFVGINGKPTYVPVDVPTPLSYPVFCVLKDLGILKAYDSYEQGEVIQ